MGTVVARTGTGKRPKADKLAEAYTMFERLNAGEPAHRIYADMGMSKATFYRRIEWARQNVHDPAVEQYRTEAVARLATARQVIARTLPMASPAEAAALVGKWVQIEETEAKIRGAYAPTKVEHRVIVEDAFARLMSELNDRPATQETHTHA